MDSPATAASYVAPNDYTSTPRQAAQFLPSPPTSAERPGYTASKRAHSPAPTSSSEAAVRPPKRRTTTSNRCSPPAAARPVPLACPESFARPYIGHLDLSTARNRAFEAGMVDGKRLSAGTRAPRRMDEEIERSYLKGFIAGTVERRVALSHPGVLAMLGQHSRIQSAQEVTDRVSSSDQECSAANTPFDTRDFELEPLPVLSKHQRHMLQRDPSYSLPDAIVPWPESIAARVVRHKDVSADEMLVHSLEDIPRPEGLSRRDLTRRWSSAQRDAIFALGDDGCWLVLEGRDHDEAGIDFLRRWIKELSIIRFPGEPLLKLTFAMDSSTTSRVAFLSGTRDQIASIVKGCTWSTNRGCFFALPNQETKSDFACTYTGIGIPREEHHLAYDIITGAFTMSAEVEIFLTERGASKADLLGSIRLEFVRIPVGFVEKYCRPPDDHSEPSDFFWNVYMDAPTNDHASLWEWRKLLATLRPGNEEIGFMWSSPRLFWCQTCGGINHPEELCPTLYYPKWFGFLPEIPV